MKQENCRKRRHLWLGGCLALFCATLSNAAPAPSQSPGESAPHSPQAIGLRVASWSLSNQMQSLSYQNVCTAYGILKMAAATGDERLRAGIEEAFRPYLLEGANPNRDNAVRNPAHRWFGFIPLELYKQTQNARYLQRGLELAELQYEGADADGMPVYTSRWYVDDIYGATTMQSLAYACTHDPKYLERAVKQVLVYAEKFQEANGLFCHGPESRFFWGRGGGWCAAAFAEVLNVLPAAHPQREKVLSAYRRMMESLMKYQSPEGAWRQLVDVPSSWPESSCTGMFLFALSEGVNHGWLPKDKYAPAVEKAWPALAGYVDEMGRLQEVCVGTGRGTHVEHYLNRPRQTGDPHGQAALLWAAASLSRADGPSPSSPSQGSSGRKKGAGPVVVRDASGKEVTSQMVGSDAVSADSTSRNQPDLLGIVTRFADVMIDRSRMNLPNAQMPLFPIVLTRDTCKIPAAGARSLVTARVQPEFRNIANPQHDQNIYQILYALTPLTGDPRYAAEADRVLGYFLKNCQEPRHGFYCWGEHLGWDLFTNGPGGFPADQPSAAIHEFYRPWVLWEKSFDLAPDNCLRFARALWRNQINHREPLSFSRHAVITRDNSSGRGHEFPRHGGMYMATWAAAYRRTKDSEMLQAVEALVGFYASRRHPQTGIIPHYTGVEYDRTGKGVQNVYTPSNVALAVELHDAAAAMPDPLKTRMLALARSVDDSILAIKHDPGPGGKGFVMFCRPENLEPAEYWSKAEDLAKGLPPRRIPYSGGWRSGYIIQYPHTWIMPALTARHRQTGDARMRKLILACADHYVASEPDFQPDPRSGVADIEAGMIGNVILALNAAFKINGDPKYLARAEWFCAWAVRHFWPDASPLPRASVRENIYSAPSRSDTLVLGLLQTWALRHGREKDIVLIATDRS